MQTVINAFILLTNTGLIMNIFMEFRSILIAFYCTKSWHQTCKTYNILGKNPLVKALRIFYLEWWDIKSSQGPNIQDTNGNNKGCVFLRILTYFNTFFYSHCIFYLHNHIISYPPTFINYLQVQLLGSENSKECSVMDVIINACRW